MEVRTGEEEPGKRKGVCWSMAVRWTEEDQARVRLCSSLRVAAQEEDEEERVEMGIEREEREEGIGPRWLGRLGLEELDGPAGLFSLSLFSYIL